jgi:hypothetical protein
MVRQALYFPKREKSRPIDVSFWELMAPAGDAGDVPPPLPGGATGWGGPDVIHP